MTPNPPIKGHNLIAEGHCVRRYDRTGEPTGWDWGCECGDKPDLATSIGATKRWHREHKAALRGAL